jgi:hypothetical protein
METIMVTTIIVASISSRKVNKFGTSLISLMFIL